MRTAMIGLVTCPRNPFGTRPDRSAGADIVATIPGRLLFVRIDGVVTPRGFMLMEAECIEPQLFFEQAPGARTSFARALFGKLTAET